MGQDRKWSFRNHSPLNSIADRGGRVCGFVRHPGACRNPWDLPFVFCFSLLSPLHRRRTKRRYSPTSSVLGNLSVATALRRNDGRDFEKTRPQKSLPLKGALITSCPFTGKVLAAARPASVPFPSPDLEAPASREGGEEQKHEAQERLKRGRDDERQGEETGRWNFPPKTRSR